MNTTGDDQLELHLLGLLHAARDERDQVARAKLNDLLRSSEAGRVAMSRLLVDEQALISRLRGDALVAILEPRSNATPTGSSVQRKSPRPSRSRIAPKAMAAAAAVLLVVAIAALRQDDPPVAARPGLDPAVMTINSPTEVAVVTQALDAVWNGRAFQTNDRVPAGPITLGSGLVRLQFLSGATLVMQGPAELEVKSEREAEVRRGLVTATVPPVAEGFTLVAAGWRAVDRGTVFGIDARSPEHAEVQVLQGQVDLHRTADGAPERTLTTGQGARVSVTGVIEPVTTAVAQFPQEQDLIARATAAEFERLDTWRRQSASRSRDPSLVLYFDFERAGDDRGLIRNLTPRAAPGHDGTLIGGEWTEGRWAGKGAVAFQRVGDLIRVLLRANLDAATFVASVRFEPVSPIAQTILLSPKVGPGQVYWMLSGRDRVGSNDGFVFIKTTKLGNDLRLASARGLMPQERGRWVQLAVVHDPANRRLRHYLDGQLLKDVPLDDATPLALNQIVIGNWGFSGEPRNFVGRVDEMAIFNRVLSEPEITGFQVRP